MLISLDNGKTVGKYTVTSKLGEGTFGAVYAVKDKDGKEYAMKCEKIIEKLPLLKLELFVMQRLQERKARHAPDLIDKGHLDNFNYIVMKYLGDSLQEAKKTGPDKHLSLGSAIGASIQCLEALEEMHWTGFLHRDVKPGNFAIGRAEFNELRLIYVLDFGMARRYVDSNNVMLQPRKKAPFRGTPRYAALASHDGKEHGRQADVESWFYMLVDFTNAKLPWKGVTEIKEVGESKRKAREEPMLSQFFKECPVEEYKILLKHIDSLSFFDEPDYGMIYKTLRGAMKAKGIKEFPYDWEVDGSKKKSN